MFVDDTYFDETIDTSEGPVRVFAGTHIFGTHLVLDEFLFFARDEPAGLTIGVRQVLAIRKQIRAWAFAAGFDELTVVYHRVGGRRNKDTIVHKRRLP